MASKVKFDPLQGLTAQLAAAPLAVVPSPAKPVTAVDESSMPVAVAVAPEHAPHAAPPAPASSNSVIAPAPPVRPSKTAVKLRKLAVYIDPAEQEKLSELDVFLRTQYAMRPSESHIMRAALILLKSNDDFVDVMRTLREQDARRNPR